MRHHIAHWDVHGSAERSGWSHVRSNGITQNGSVGDVPRARSLLRPFMKHRLQTSDGRGPGLASE